MTSEAEQWQDGQRAENYARQTRIGSGIIYGRLARRIAQSVGSMDQGATVVDIGTGPGLLAVELHKLWPKARIVAIDPSDEMLRIARQNAARAGLSNYEAQQGTAEQIPLESGCCDLVISQSSFHEWNDPREGLTEILRILAPGGSLIVKDYNRGWLSGWKTKILGKLHPMHMFRFGFEDVAAMAQEVGFERVDGQAKGVQYVIRAVKGRGDSL